MPSFLFPSLAAAAAGLVFVPVLIHLINLLRHRWGQWAAMQVLLQAQRMHSTWILLSQLLLQLWRMVAFAAWGRGQDAGPGRGRRAHRTRHFRLPCEGLGESLGAARHAAKTGDGRR